jgi:predicted CopG family antitoxin
MQKKLTITMDEKVYAGLQKVIGRGHISEFIESLVRPHVLPKEIECGYKAMAADAVREDEAWNWIEGTVGDGTDEAR